MKAISLWQPWATAIAVGAKTIETRSWKRGYTGPIAIHAAKKWTLDQQRIAEDFQARGILPKDLPLGEVVATADLIAYVDAEYLDGVITDLERELGDYRKGRHGWILRNIKALDPTVPYKGAQGFFNVPNRLLR